MKYGSIFKRFTGNPILLPTSNAWESKAVFNAAAAEKDGKIFLVYRARGEDERSSLGLAWSNDGFNFERLDKPVMIPDPDNFYEERGLEDPRIVYMDGWYWMTYVAASLYPPSHPLTDGNLDKPWRVRIALARTKDFTNFEKLGIILPDLDSKDQAPFPERIDGKIYMLHRIYPNIQLEIGKDWGKWESRQTVLTTRTGMWDCERVGSNFPPIKTKDGWLLTYHGNDKKRIYRTGAALLDLKDPSKVLARSREPFISPETEYECNGWECNGKVRDIVFPCGAIQHGDELIIYYGGADRCLNAGTVSIGELLASLEPINN